MPKSPTMIVISVNAPKAGIGKFYRVPLKSEDRTTKNKAFATAESMYKTQMGLPANFTVHSRMLSR